MVGLAPGDGEIKGGEALAVTGTEPMMGRWHVLWTRINCEQIVHDQLATHGFAPFLPAIQAWCWRGGVRRLVQLPLFRLLVVSVELLQRSVAVHLDFTALEAA